MLRMLFSCAAVLAAACSNNPSTGPASLLINGTAGAKSAWIEPTHVGYMINGASTNYLGWLIRYTNATPGTECTNDLTAVATIKVITTQIESDSVTRAMLMAESIGVVTQTPDAPPTVDVAVVSTSDTTAQFTSGIIMITSDTTTDKNGDGEVDGSVNVMGNGMGGAITLNGDFYAHKCFL